MAVSNSEKSVCVFFLNKSTEKLAIIKNINIIAADQIAINYDKSIQAAEAQINKIS